jgi:deoxyribose-phosphate aldolase
MLSRKMLAKMIDYSLLRPEATRDDIIALCEEAKQYHFAAVCIFPYWVRLAEQQLRDSDVKVCAVVGYPFGVTTVATKVIEAKGVIAGGATEIDVMMNLGALKSKRYDAVRRDIEEVVNIANVAGLTRDGQDIMAKVIIEIGLLTEEEARCACQIAKDAGADFIKTSTGFGPRGTTIEDIRLIRSVVGREIGIKAAGGIDGLEPAIRMLDAGANRIGSSAAVAIVQSLQEDEEEEEPQRPEKEDEEDEEEIEEVSEVD